MYRVKIPDLGKSVHFVIMKSVFNTEKEIHKIWDLKGSTLGRRAKRGDGVHKDLDFVEEGRKICVSPETKGAIMDQMRRDAKFLAKMQIMDYSLLLGVHLRTRAELEGERRRNLLIRTNTPMRREQLMNSNKNTFQQFIDGAKEILGVRTFDETRTATQSDDDTDFDSEKEGDSEVKEGIPTIMSRGELDLEEKTVLKTSSSELPLAADVPNPYTKRDDYGIESSCGDSNEIYFAGVIDILQLYTTRKWGETMMRKAAGNPEKAISCVSPELYADRFVEFIGSTMP
mmetsp:Transcript_4868/g.7334  ORF Transcript_4868/g.7334 Transcript_4868/m.7334 type:complete len:286 (+) Transcript_4868:3-860(+)